MERFLVSEEFLQYVWAQRLYGGERQTTQEGVSVEILNPGLQNHDAGPDFFNAQIRVGHMTWAGNVEIHLTSDDWFRHGHDSDPAYDNVVLHVVGKSTGTRITNSRGLTVPEIELRYPTRIVEHLTELMQSHAHYPIRCAGRLSDVPSIVRSSWLDALLVERMQRKSERAEAYKAEAKGDKDQEFFVLLARTLGGKVNAEPMEMLARHTPVKYVLKHRSPLQSEALLLGQAGLLGKEADDSLAQDDYVSLLRREYSVLQAKFGLEPIDASMWKYLRLRPANFPDVRIVQLAALVCAIGGNFEGALRAANVESMQKMFAVGPSDYWDLHFRLGILSSRSSAKRIGADFRRIIIINAVIPFLLQCARSVGDEEWQGRVISSLRELPVESNSKLDLWGTVGLRPRDEGDAQALLHLLQEYCEPGRCLRCRFGHSIVSRRAPSGGGSHAG